MRTCPRWLKRKILGSLVVLACTLIALAAAHIYTRICTDSPQHHAIIH